MPGRGYKITSFLVCDDIRREDNGKEILIGVYRDSIVVREFPVILRQIVFRITAKVQHTDFHEYSIILRGPGRKKLLTMNGKLEIRSKEAPIHLVLNFEHPQFDQAGTYSFALGLDSSPRKIGEFEVRLPKSESEWGRLGVTEQNT